MNSLNSEKMSFKSLFPEILAVREFYCKIITTKDKDMLYDGQNNISKIRSIKWKYVIFLYNRCLSMQFRHISSVFRLVFFTSLNTSISVRKGEIFFLFLSNPCLSARFAVWISDGNETGVSAKFRKFCS